MASMSKQARPHNQFFFILEFFINRIGYKYACGWSIMKPYLDRYNIVSSNCQKVSKYRRSWLVCLQSTISVLAIHSELLPPTWIDEEAADTTPGLRQLTCDKAVHRSSKTIRDQYAGAYPLRRRLRPNNTPQRSYSQTFGCCCVSKRTCRGWEVQRTGTCSWQAR